MTGMTREQYVTRENERATRLLEYVKGELRNMYVGSRMKFTCSLFNYLMPEVQELVRDGDIDPKEIKS